jgi:hypothetical protein
MISTRTRIMMSEPAISDWDSATLPVMDAMVDSDHEQLPPPPPRPLQVCDYYWVAVPRWRHPLRPNTDAGGDNGIDHRKN